MSSAVRGRSHGRRWLMVLTAIAIVIRFSLAFQSGYWRDEALFLGIVESSTWAGMIDFLRFSESHPPLFYIAMRIWIGLFGDSHASVVALPVLIGAIAVPAIYVITRKVFDMNAAIVAASMTAISPSLSFYSALVRPYSLLPLLVLLSCYALWRGIATNTRSSWIAYVVLCLALVYTHNFAWVIVLSQAITTCICAIVNRPRRRSILRSVVLSWLAIIVCYLPWLSTFIVQSRFAGYGAAHVANMRDAIALLRFAFVVVAQSILAPTIDPEFSTASLMVAAAGLILASAGVVQWFVVRRRATSANRIRTDSVDDHRMAFLTFGWLPLIALGVGFAFSFRSYLLIERCLIMLVPPLLVVAGRLISSTWLRLRDYPGARWLAWSVVVVVGAPQLLGLATMYRQPRSNARELARLVDSRAQHSDLIIVAPVWLASSLNYYLRSDNTQFDYPDGGRRISVSFSRLWDRLDNPAALTRLSHAIADSHARSNTIWLITDRENFARASRDDYQLARSPGQFEAIGRVRVNQIVSLLQRQYHEQGSIVQTRGRSPRFEELIALKFSPQ